MSYKTIPEGMDLSTEFPTYILAFCPYTDSWFATNNRFFYYEYPQEFQTEADAIKYFKQNAKLFLSEEIRMDIQRHAFCDGGVFLENTHELVSVSIE